MPAIAVFLWFNVIQLFPGQNIDLPRFDHPQFACGARSTVEGEISYYGVTSPSGCAGRHRFICFAEGGYFNVNLQLNLMPGPEAEGHVQMDGLNFDPSMWDFLPRSTYLLSWKTGAGYTQHSNTMMIQAHPKECFQLRYSSTGPAQINPDERVTRLTIHKIH